MVYTCKRDGRLIYTVDTTRSFIMSVLSFCVYKVHHQFGIRNCIMADIADILMTSSFVSSIYKNGIPSAVPSSAQGVYTIWCAWLIDMVSHCAGMHSWSDPALTINVQMYSAKRSSTPCFSKQLLFLLFDLISFIGLIEHDFQWLQEKVAYRVVRELQERARHRLFRNFYHIDTGKVYCQPSSH